MEGGNTGITDKEDTKKMENTTAEHMTTGSNGSKEGSLINIVSQSLHGLDLLVELHGRYRLDLSEDTTVHLPLLLSFPPPLTVPDTSLHTND